MRDALEDDSLSQVDRREYTAAAALVATWWTNLTPDLDDVRPDGDYGGNQQEWGLAW
jgi:hypothetical protein